MAFYPVSDKQVLMPMLKALRKNSGATTVSIEYNPTDGNEEVAEVEGSAVISISQLEGASRRVRALGGGERLTLLSSKLRDADVAALWTTDVDAVAAFASEQKRAKGDFPGPCPIVFNGELAHADKAVAAGATAVVLTASNLEKASELDDAPVEIIWEVSTADEVAQIVEAGSGDAFLLPAAAAAHLAEALPEDSLKIGAIRAMQRDEGEIVQGKALVEAGCRALLVRDACVGDIEDVAYVRYVVKSLTSKRSTKFAIDGHTGSINGHFGVRQGGPAVPADGWLRKRS